MCMEGRKKKVQEDKKKIGEIYFDQFARNVTNGLDELSLFVCCFDTSIYAHKHLLAHTNTCAAVCFSYEE